MRYSLMLLGTLTLAGGCSSGGNSSDGAAGASAGGATATGGSAGTGGTGGSGGSGAIAGSSGAGGTAGASGGAAGAASGGTAGSSGSAGMAGAGGVGGGGGGAAGAGGDPCGPFFTETAGSYTATANMVVNTAGDYFTQGNTYTVVIARGTITIEGTAMGDLVYDFGDRTATSQCTDAGSIYSAQHSGGNSPGSLVLGYLKMPPMFTSFGTGFPGGGTAMLRLVAN